MWNYSFCGSEAVNYEQLHMIQISAHLCKVDNPQAFESVLDFSKKFIFYDSPSARQAQCQRLVVFADSASGRWEWRFC